MTGPRRRLASVTLGFSGATSTRSGPRSWLRRACTISATVALRSTRSPQRSGTILGFSRKSFRRASFGARAIRRSSFATKIPRVLTAYRHDEVDVGARRRRESTGKRAVDMRRCTQPLGRHVPAHPAVDDLKALVEHRRYDLASLLDRQAPDGQPLDRDAVREEDARTGRRARLGVPGVPARSTPAAARSIRTAPPRPRRAGLPRERERLRG